MKKLERDSLLADRAAVTALLDTMPESDPVGRLSFQSRLAEIDEQLAKLEGAHEPSGSVALLFAGEPVHGTRSINAEFASAVLKSFQDLVTKRVAGDELGKLGARGRIPIRATTSLSISDMVRGSVGFLLEESGENLEISDTAVKIAIDDVTDVIARTASEHIEDFESAVENLDPRLLVSLRDFFRSLDEGGATIRIVESERDASLDTIAVRRARGRVDAMDIDEQESDAVVGELLGLLPQSRRFEMRLADTGEVIRGTVSPGLATGWVELIEAPGQEVVGRTWRAKMRIREVHERNKPPRKLYALLGLIEKVGN